MITMGKQGLVTFDHPDTASVAVDGRLRSEYVPALSSHTVDPLGCGDSLLATATLTLASGGSLQAAALLGSLAASIQAGSIGNRPIDSDTLVARLSQRASEPTRLAS
jgi:sugar/nucleoside kinase (ribokinase family)